MRALPMSRRYFEKGQALLIVLLSMAVVLTIVLSILSRSVTDIAITTQEEESLRAFSAAEAGVEQALVSGITGVFSGDFDNAFFSGEVTSVGEGSASFLFPISILSGESLVTWFVSHDEDGQLACDVDNPCFRGNTIKFCWGKEGTPSDDAATPALEISLYYAETPGDYTTVRVARAGLDPNNSRVNNFDKSVGGTCEIGTTTFAFSKEISLSDLAIPPASYSVANGLQFAKVKLFYNTATPQPLGVDVNFPGNQTLPSQGLSITSHGSSGTANRKIEVFQSYEEVPSVFETAVFSPGGIVK